MYHVLSLAPSVLRITPHSLSYASTHLRLYFQQGQLHRGYRRLRRITFPAVAATRALLQSWLWVFRCSQRSHTCRELPRVQTFQYRLMLFRAHPTRDIRYPPPLMFKAKLTDRKRDNTQRVQLDEVGDKMRLEGTTPPNMATTNGDLRGRQRTPDSQSSPAEASLRLSLTAKQWRRGRGDRTTRERVGSRNQTRPVWPVPNSTNLLQLKVLGKRLSPVSRRG